jgi:hypothetical protein
MGGQVGDGQVFGTQPSAQQQQQQYGQQPQYGQQQNQQQQNQQQPPGTPGGGYSQYSQYSQQATTQYGTPQQQQQQQPPPGGSSGYPAGSGSITRFASPQQQQRQPGTPLYPQYSPYNFQPPPQPSGASLAAGGSAGMSFAQRSAMMQQQQPNVYGGSGAGGGGGQQQPQPAPPQGGGGGYSQQPPPQQQGLYGSQSQPSQAQPPPTPPRQQQQQQQQQQPPANMAGMSFAQRSAMMQQHQPNVYGGGGQQQQQQQQPMYGQPPQPGTSTPQPSMTGAPQQQQQQQPNYGGMPQQQQPGMGGSYAQRSVMARGGPGMPQPQPGMQQQQQQQQPGMPQQPSGMPMPQQQQQPFKQPNMLVDPPEVIAQQNRLLTDATRKVQEHAYYMKQAMERNDLPQVLDRAASMVGELGEHAHAHHHHHLHPPAPGATGSTTALSPKNYYELHLRALEELPNLEDYLLNVAVGTTTSTTTTSTPSNANNMATGGPASHNLMNTTMNNHIMSPGGPTNHPLPSPGPGQPPVISYTMKELYDCVQYCPNVLSRLYLQICAASALIRSGQVGARWVLKDMIQAVKCVQNPVRGLFLRHYLLQAFRDKLPNDPIPPDEEEQVVTTAGGTMIPPTTPAPVVAADVTSVEQGTVKDSYEFILANFIEMNKLWVRIQHLPGDGRSKEVRRRREKDRNELRILVGTNLVRLSSLDSVTSRIYGQVILPTVLDHIVVCADPLAQAYLIDCIVQVFPDEYHIETMPILLGVCPKLRDKVNVRTILQSLMDRLANYLADEELLDEQDSNQVKQSLANDSFRMFDECVQNVYNARGPKLQAKEVIRLQTSLLSFTMKCYQGNLEHVTLCLNHCVLALQQVGANQALMMEGQPNPPPKTHLDEIATKELETLLSIPLDELAFGVLTLDHYAELVGFLPWTNRRQLALTMLEAVNKAGTSPTSVKEMEELFSVIAPVLRDEQDAPPIAHTMMTTTADATERTANLMANLGVSPNPQQRQHQFEQAQGASSYHQQQQQEQEASMQYNNTLQDAALVSKLIQLLDHSDTDVLYEMLAVARNHLNAGKRQRTNKPYVALVFALLKLARRIQKEEMGDTEPETKKESKKENEEEKVAEEESEKPAENGEGDADADKTEAEVAEKDSEESKVETVEDDEEPSEEEEKKPAEEDKVEEVEKPVVEEEVEPAEEEKESAAPSAPKTIR